MLLGTDLGPDIPVRQTWTTFWSFDGGWPENHVVVRFVVLVLFRPVDETTVAQSLCRAGVLEILLE